MAVCLYEYDDDERDYWNRQKSFHIPDTRRNGVFHQCAHENEHAMLISRNE